MDEDEEATEDDDSVGKDNSKLGANKEKALHAALEAADHKAKVVRNVDFTQEQVNQVVAHAAAQSMLQGGFNKKDAKEAARQAAIAAGASDEEAEEIAEAAASVELGEDLSKAFPLPVHEKVHHHNRTPAGNADQRSAASSKADRSSSPNAGRHQVADTARRETPNSADRPGSPSGEPLSGSDYFKQPGAQKVNDDEIYEGGVVRKREKFDDAWDALRKREDPLEDHCLRWEKFSREVAQSIALRKDLPVPPTTKPQTPQNVARISEAALTCAAALWPSVALARELSEKLAKVNNLRSQMNATVNIVQATMARSEPHLAEALRVEREENLRLMKRDVILIEKVAAARSELYKMNARSIESAEVHVSMKTEVFEAWHRADKTEQGCKAQEVEIVMLKRCVADLNRKVRDTIEQTMSYQKELEAADAKTKRLRAQVYDSELARKQAIEASRGQGLGLLASPTLEMSPGYRRGHQANVGSGSQPSSPWVPAPSVSVHSRAWAPMTNELGTPRQKSQYPTPCRSSSKPPIPLAQISPRSRSSSPAGSPRSPASFGRPASPSPSHPSMRSPITMARSASVHASGSPARKGAPSGQNSSGRSASMRDPRSAQGIRTPSPTRSLTIRGNLTLDPVKQRTSPKPRHDSPGKDYLADNGPQGMSPLAMTAFAQMQGCRNWPIEKRKPLYQNNAAWRGGGKSKVVSPPGQSATSPRGFTASVAGRTQLRGVQK